MKVVAVQQLPAGGEKRLRQVEASHTERGADRRDLALWIQDMIKIERTVRIVDLLDDGEPQDR
jgi:hypothetical protein